MLCIHHTNARTRQNNNIMKDFATLPSAAADDNDANDNNIMMLFVNVPHCTHEQ